MSPLMPSQYDQFGAGDAADAGGQVPPELAAMLAQLGGPQGAPPEAPEAPEAENGNWLVDAINAVHAGMVQEQNPKQVSLLGAILNQLTTFQANAAAGQQGQGAPPVG